MIIREYQEGDFQQVENLWKATGIYRPERGDSSETILRCTRQGGKFLILEDKKDKRITGTSWLTWDGRRVHMQYFAILPVIQGKGYGRKLAEASMSFARTFQAPVKLEVHRDSIPAVKLYQSMGFKVLKGYEVYMVHN